jgi:ketosteroid isomerase-like protein
MFTGMAALQPEFSYPAGHEVIVNGDFAIHIAPWDMIARTAEGAPITQSGLSVAVLHRQPERDWKMVIDNPHSARLLASQH